MSREIGDARHNDVTSSIGIGIGGALVCWTLSWGGKLSPGLIWTDGGRCLAVRVVCARP